MIEWTKIDQPRFDRIVETLILRKYRGEAAVRVIDGRGGDGGIDIVVTWPTGRAAVFQLKYFPEGFSNGFSPRRKQIKKSFRTVMRDHSPDIWVLVAPRNLADGEARFIESLGREAPEGTSVPEVAYYGRSELDGLLIDYPDVDRWLTRDHLKESAIVFNRERDLLLGGTRDLAERVSSLGSVVDSADPDWTFDFERHGNIVTQILRPLHDNAAERSPVNIALSGSMGPEHEELSHALANALKFGSFSDVKIPRECISKLVVTGPELIAGTFEPDTVVIRSLPVDVHAVGKTFEIKFFDIADECLGAFDGLISKVHRGSEGFSNEVSFFSGHLTMRFVIPVRWAKGESHSVGIAYRLEGLHPAEVVEVLRLRELVCNSARVETYVDGHELAKFAANSFEALMDDPEILDFAADLEVIYRHCNLRYLMPMSFGIEDRINARVARQVIQGYAVACPDARSVNCQITEDAELTDELHQLLASESILRLPANYRVSICGRTIDLGDIVAFHPNAKAVNGNEAIEALRAGDAGGFVVRMVPGDDPYFYVHTALDGNGDSYPDFVSWGFDEIDEPWLQNPFFDEFERVA